MRALRAAAFAGWACLAAVSGPRSAAGTAEPAASIALVPGKPTDVTCETKSVVVATDAANATAGVIRLQLALDGAPEGSVVPDPALGTWRVLDVAAAHKGAFAAAQREVCKDGCPLSRQSSGEIQLWAPRPNGLERLGENDVLLLAVIKPGSSELRASTFRGKQIEALEEGRCKGDRP